MQRVRESESQRVRVKIDPMTLTNKVSDDSMTLSKKE